MPEFAPGGDPLKDLPDFYYIYYPSNVYDNEQNRQSSKDQILKGEDILIRLLDMAYPPGINEVPSGIERQKYLQKIVNSLYGGSSYVDNFDQVPWENQSDGETYDGRKSMYETVPFQKVKVGGVEAAIVVTSKEVAFIVPGKSGYRWFEAKPANSKLIDKFDIMLKTLKFNNN